MDYQSVTFGGIGIITLVIGLVKVAKDAGFPKEKLKILAPTVGVILFIAVQLALMYPVIEPWLYLVVYGLGGGVAASGVYDIAKELTGRSE